MRRISSAVKMKSRNHLWMAVLISVVYFLLIGVVILVLLLAPKYPSLSGNYDQSHYLWKSPDLSFDTGSAANDVQIPYEIPHKTLVDPKPFVPSRRDPVYDIDPRSNLNSHEDSTATYVGGGSNSGSGRDGNRPSPSDGPHYDRDNKGDDDNGEAKDLAL